MRGARHRVEYKGTARVSPSGQYGGREIVMGKVTCIMRGLSAAACVAATVGLGGATARAATSTVSFRSTTFPYSIQYPAGWAHRVVLSGQQKVEQFGLGPWGRDVVNVSVTAIAIRGASAADDGALRRQLEAQRRKTYGNLSEVGTVRTSNHRLVMYAWNHTVNGQSLADTEVAFGDNGRVWVVVMVSDQGAGQRRWLPTYAAMLRSMRLRTA